MTPPESNDNIATDSTKKPDDNVTIILPEIISEIDVPFNDDTDSDDSTTIMSKRDVHAYEAKLKYAIGMKNLQLKDHALHLIIGCFIAMIVLYFIDVFLLNRDLKNSEMASSVFDFLKYIITTLLGYLFATKSSSNE